MCHKLTHHNYGHHESASSRCSRWLSMTSRFASVLPVPQLVVAEDEALDPVAPDPRHFYGGGDLSARVGVAECRVTRLAHEPLDAGAVDAVLTQRR